MKKILLSLLMLMPLLAFAESTEVYDFTANAFGLPTAKDNAVSALTAFTNETTQQTISVINAYSIKSNDTEAIMLMKSLESYILFPATTAPVTKVIVHSGVNCAAKAKVTVYADDQSLGELSLSSKDADFEVEVPAEKQAEGVVFKVLSDQANNTQIGKVSFVLNTNYTDLWLRGYNGWEATDSNKLNTTDGINYTLGNVVLRNGSEFKIANADYTVEFGGASNVVAGVDYTLVEKGSNISVAEEMTCIVNFNLESKAFRIEKTGDAPEPVISYCLHGTFVTGNWEDLELTEEDGLWVAKNVATVAGEFGVKVLTDGSQSAWYGAAEEMTVESPVDITLTNVKAKNIKIVEGRFNFALDPETMVLDITFVPVLAPEYYKEITTMDEFTVDSKYIFYYGDTEKEMSYALGDWASNNSYFTVVKNVVVEENQINATSADNEGILPLQIVAGTAEGTYALYDGENYVKCTNGTNNNKLAKSTDLVAECNLQITAEDGAFKMLFTENSNDNQNLFQCNASSGQERFSNYKTGSQNNPRLFKKVDTQTAISNIAVQNGEKVVYNLQGVRVNAETLPAGLYIINGKKVLVK